MLGLLVVGSRQRGIEEGTDVVRMLYQRHPSTVMTALSTPPATAARSSQTSGTAVVPFSLPEAADVRLVVYDALGREVAVLADGTHEAGRHTATFEGGTLAPGVYLARLVVETEAGPNVLTRRFTVAR